MTQNDLKEEPLGDDTTVGTNSTGISCFGFPTQVPDTDISRISFYLKCCILGCGVGSSHIIPTVLLDYANAHLFPKDWRDLIFQLALNDFSLDNLLNRVIIVNNEYGDLQEEQMQARQQRQQQDNRRRPTNDRSEEQTIRREPWNVFQSINSLDEVLRMESVQPLSSVPFWYTGRIMICNPEWIMDYYILPIQRYYITSCQKQVPDAVLS